MTNPSALIHAPFDRLDQEQMTRKVNDFIDESGLSIYREYFLKGAFLAQNDSAFESLRDDNLALTDEERASLQQEKTRRWKHPRALWQLIILCAIGAATQGWDESAIDGGRALRSPYLRSYGQHLTTLVCSPGLLQRGVWHR